MKMKIVKKVNKSQKNPIDGMCGLFHVSDLLDLFVESLTEGIDSDYQSLFS